MAETLYSREILKLAMTLGEDNMPADADGMAELRSPVCGSKMRAGVALNSDGHIEALTLEVKACAMGQASAALLKRHGIGLGQRDIAAIHDGIERFLAGQGEMPGDWPELTALAPAKEYPARHGAILLPYDTVLAAMADARGG